MGSIIAVPLSDGRFAYAKVYQDFNLAVYDFLSKEMVSIQKVLKHKIAFFQAATDLPIKSGEWPIIGEDPFPNEEASWGPPKAVVFPPGGTPLESADLKIYYKGALRGRAKPEEVKGLDFNTIAQRPELFIRILEDRLIRGNHAAYRVPD